METEREFQISYYLSLSLLSPPRPYLQRSKQVAAVSLEENLLGQAFRNGPSAGGAARWHIPVKASQTARAVTCWGARTPEVCTQFRPRALIFTARTHMTMHWCCMFDTACQWKCRPVRGEAGGLQGWGSEPRLTIVSA